MVKTKYLKRRTKNRRTKNRKTKRGGAAAAAAVNVAEAVPGEFSSSDTLPKLDDTRYIRLMSQFASMIFRNRKILRSQTQGFIACKFSALAYLLISILWVDDELPTYEEKMDVLEKIKFIVHVPKNEYEFMGLPFINNNLLRLFIQNQRSHENGAWTHIRNFADIKLTIGNDDVAALLGIIFSGPAELARIAANEIIHYFIVVKRGVTITGDPTYAFISSYGSDKVAFEQFETPLYPVTFDSFILSLSKDTKKKQDQLRINKYIRAHFLNENNMVADTKDKEYIDETRAVIEEELQSGKPRKEPNAFYEFLNSKQYEDKNNPEDIASEMKLYTMHPTSVVQFNNIYNDLHNEIHQRQFSPNRKEAGHAAFMLAKKAAKAEKAARKSEPMGYIPSRESLEIGPMTRSKTLALRLEDELMKQGSLNKNGAEA